MSEYVLGVDAGNTKTIALVARTDGVIVGWGRSGCGDIYGAESAEAALEAVSEAVMAALSQSGIERGELAAATFSMAGADWPEDYEFLTRELERRRLGKKVIVLNDALGALRAGTEVGVGVVVVCGTGAATGARAPDGRIWHSSFWQLHQGAQELGRRTLRAVYLAELGIEPPTALTRRVLDFFQFGCVEEVLHRLTARTDRMRFDTRHLARLLMDEAARGDEVACQIVHEHGAALGNYALVASRRVGIDATSFTLVLAGSVLRSSTHLLAQAIIERVQSEAPEASAVHARYEPVFGALFWSLETIGVRIDGALLARQGPSLPPRSLFET